MRTGSSRAGQRCGHGGHPRSPMWKLGLSRGRRSHSVRPKGACSLPEACALPLAGLGCPSAGLLSGLALGYRLCGHNLTEPMDAADTACTDGLLCLLCEGVAGAPTHPQPLDLGGGVWTPSSVHGTERADLVPCMQLARAWGNALEGRPSQALGLSLGFPSVCVHGLLHSPRAGTRFLHTITCPDTVPVFQGSAQLPPPCPRERLPGRASRKRAPGRVAEDSLGATQGALLPPSLMGCPARRPLVRLVEQRDGSPGPSSSSKPSVQDPGSVQMSGSMPALYRADVSGTL